MATGDQLIEGVAGNGSELQYLEAYTLGAYGLWTSNSTMYPVFVNASTNAGNDTCIPYTDSALHYKPSTNTLYAGTYVAESAAPTWATGVKGVAITYSSGDDAGFVESSDKTAGTVYKPLQLHGDPVRVRDGDLGVQENAPSERLHVGGTNPRIYLGDATAPGTTTNRLYSVSGELYWAGTAIGGSSSMGLVNVADYGAVGDGSTDDTTAITNAVAELSANSTLYFPPGQYKLTSTVTLPTANGISVVGAGPWASRIYSTSNIALFQINITSSIYYYSFFNMGFQGPSGGGSTSSKGIYIYGTTDAYFSTSTFSHLHFYDVGYGIHVSKSTSPSTRFDWNLFTNLTQGGTTDTLFRMEYGSGTGNVFSAITAPQVSSVAIHFGGYNSANLGDILINGLHVGTATYGCLFGASASYKERIAICNSQFDAGCTYAHSFAGSAYGQLRIQNINYGGATSYAFENNPTSSLVELPTGFYGYNSAGTPTTIFAY